MQRRTLFAVAPAFVAVTSVASVALQARTRPDIGALAPSFTAPDTFGRPIRLQDNAGRLIVLEWSNPDCPFAGKHYESGNMQQLQDAVRSRGAWFTVLSLPPGSYGHVDALEAEAMVERRRSRATATLLDSSTEIAGLYGALATPHIFIVDPAGRLAYQGGIDSIASTKVEDIPRAVPYVRNALDALAEGRAVDPAVTRPYGCPVKIV